MNIQEKVDFIITIAKELEGYFQDEEKLYEAVNKLDQSALDEIIESGQPQIDKSNNLYFGPVILVRDKVCRFLREGKEINAELIDEIKEKFINKEIEYFSDYPDFIQNAIKDYEIGASSPFHVWKKNFRILYTFFFRPSLKEKVNNYLDDISDYLISELKLDNFQSHWVNFDGIQNFGATRCWLALFPKQKVSHTNAYQLFISLQHNGFEYGIVMGSEIKRKIGNDKYYYVEELNQTQDFQDVLNGFKIKKDEVINLNSKIKQVWKYAPGENAKYWDEFLNNGIIAVGWDDIGDLNQYQTQEEIADALDVGEFSNQSWNLDLFRNASKGDIVIVNRGRKEAIGIGIITGEYEFRKTRSYFKHVRPVSWVINKNVKFDKSMFRADTFSPTLKYFDIRNAYIEKYPELKEQFEKIDEGVISPREPGTEPEISYYWLNANAKIWNFMDFKVGETQTYTSKNKKGNKRRIYQNFLDANPGDIVVGYLTSPFRQIVAILEVTKSLYQEDIEGEVVEFKITEFLENPVGLETLKSNPELKNAEPIQNIQGSLFKLSHDEFEIIQNIIEEFNPPQKIEIEIYPLEDAVNESGVRQSRFEEIISLLEEKKQIVIQGAPGTGKTYLAKIIAKFLAQNESSCEIIQFHPSYSYEDFVEGYRPSDDGGLTLKGGIFKDICRKAMINPKSKFVLIIDEINRGDISKIFGELLYLLEYRKDKIRLTYTPEIDFLIPRNLYIIGTMNLADRSLAMIDYALRRRFCFITLYPDYDLIKKFNKDSLLDIGSIITNIQNLNQKIAANPSLGKDFEIGHSYFLDKLKDRMTMEKVWKFEIMPLLEEYYFDNKEEVNSLKQILFQNVPD